VYGTHGVCFAASLVDEDDWDENGEALLGEAGDVANEKAEIEGNDDQQNDHHPRADPKPKRHKVQPVLTAKRTHDTLRLLSYDEVSYHHIIIIFVH